MSATPTDGDILSGIREVALEHLGVDGVLTADQPLVESMRLDSVRMLTLVAELENRFAVNLEEGDESGLVTIGDLVTLLQRRLAG